MSMTWQARLCAGATVVGLVAGGLKYLEPRTLEQVREDQRQEQVEQLADSHEKTREQNRKDGDAAAEADRRDRLRPGEHRPPGPHMRIRLR